MSINRVNISGNLTRDSELRSLPSGTNVLSFGVAVNDRRRNPQTGEWEDYPNYCDCVVFGNRAEPLSRFLFKGTKVAIEGKLRWSSWEDKNGGGKRSKLEIVVDEVEFLSPRQGNAQQGAPQAQYAPRQQQRYPNPPQQQQAPQMPSQAPSAPVPPQGYGYQQQMPQQAPAPQAMYIADEDIPFFG